MGGRWRKGSGAIARTPQARSSLARRVPPAAASRPSLPPPPPPPRWLRRSKCTRMCRPAGSPAAPHCQAGPSSLDDGSLGDTPDGAARLLVHDAVLADSQQLGVGGDAPLRQAGRQAAGPLRRGKLSAAALRCAALRRARMARPAPPTPLPRPSKCPPQGPPCTGGTSRPLQAGAGGPARGRAAGSVASATTT